MFIVNLVLAVLFLNFSKDSPALGAGGKDSEKGGAPHALVAGVGAAEHG